MPSKSNDNNKNSFKDLEKKISPVLVINNSSLKPYVEIFDYAPENIYQQPLGSLVGFFEVKEYSQESAYIVNFLTSVLKKEYYINPKRPVADSLDSALHKVNLALSELAKQGNVEWLGKLNAAICVLEKNNTHFSVTGNAKIFLYRKQALTEISEDLALDEHESHPLKTFVNVSSGRLEKDDRLLITSEDIFHILSQQDLKKNFQRLPDEKFVQFLKTALSNQLEMIASLVVDLSEPVKIKPAKVSTAKNLQPAASNVFSEKTFAKTTETAITLEETMALAQALEQEGENLEYIDKKTGHIYIQGQSGEVLQSNQMQLYWEAAREKAAEGWFVAKNDLRRRYVLFKKQVAKKIEQHKIEKQRQAEIAAEEAARLEAQRLELQQLEAERAQQAAQEEVLRLIEEEKILAEQEALREQEIINAPIKQVEEIFVEEVAPAEQPLSFQEKLRLAKAEQKRSAVIDLRPKAIVEVEPEIVDTLSQIAEQQAEPELPELSVKIKLVEKVPFSQQLIQNLKLSTAKLAQQSAVYLHKAKTKLHEQRTEVGNPSTAKQESRYAPRFETIKSSYAKFSSKQKLYTLGALVLVFVVPVFIARWLNQPKAHPITELQKVPTTLSELMSGEKNINLTPKEQKILAKPDLVTTLITSAGPVAVSQNSITTLGQQKKDYPLPEGSGKVIKAAYMSDLALVLVVTDQDKIISFSPNSLKFTDNKIDLPGKSAAQFFGTYMTYLYVLDPSANQIYRYPRADGGFGDKLNWYKDSAVLSDVSSITLDDSMYVVQNGKVLKLFKGQAQPFKLEASSTPINISQVYTTLDDSNLWALDTQTTRLVQYSKDGSIVAQYFDENLKSATSLAVDEKNKTAYVTTSSGLISISL